MKKIKTLIAAAAVLGLGVTVSSISPAAVSMQTAEAATVKQGLVKVKNKYYYYNAKGKKVKNKWVTVKVKGKKQKYYFNKKGAALTGTGGSEESSLRFRQKRQTESEEEQKTGSLPAEFRFCRAESTDRRAEKGRIF